MALTPQEQHAFYRLMIDLCHDDPQFTRRLVMCRHHWTRRVRLFRGAGAAGSFIGLVTLSMSGAVGLAWALIAAALAVAGVSCGVGAAVPFPVPTRARFSRIRLRARRIADRNHLAIRQRRGKTARYRPKGGDVGSTSH